MSAFQAGAKRRRDARSPWGASIWGERVLYLTDDISLLRAVTYCRFTVPATARVRDLPNLATALSGSGPGTVEPATRDNQATMDP